MPLENLRIGFIGAGERPAGGRSLRPMARGTLAAIESAGIAGGMPGPVSRGDVHTVAGHVAAFVELDAPVMESYLLLCRRTVDLALQRGAIDTATADQLRALLRNTLPPPR